MTDVQHKRIVITGASSGIGAALAVHYAAPGVLLCLIARTEAAMREVAQQCIARGSAVNVYVADVTDAARMREVSTQILAEVGLPDLVIANAGIRIEDPADYTYSTAAAEIMAVNYHGVIHSFASFIAPMKQRGSGHLVAVSSIAALRATPNSGIYSASKGAVNLWTEGLRLQLAPHNVAVTTACSGFVRTAMTADIPFHMPGILSPEQAAAIIAQAVAKRRSRIVFPWQSRLIWGIFAAMPGGMYDQVILLAKKLWPKRKAAT